MNKICHRSHVAKTRYYPLAVGLEVRRRRLYLGLDGRNSSLGAQRGLAYYNDM
jgi:hypothetical protein